MSQPLRDQLRQLGNARRTEVVEFPDLGLSVPVRELAAADILALNKLDDADKTGEVVRRSLYDPATGTNVFSPEEWPDVYEQWPAGVVFKIAKVVSTLSGLTEEAVTDIQGNLPGTPPSDSPIS
jgi:hypothetical protein